MGVLFPQTYSYTPFQKGKRIKGRFVSTYGSSSTFSGNVQPMNEIEVNALNIGRKNIGKIKIYTDHVFNIAEESSNINGDLVDYDGFQWEVIGKDHHTGTLLPHKKYIAELRIDDNLGASS